VALQPRSGPLEQRLVVTAPLDLGGPFEVDAIGAPVECLIASREALATRRGVDAHWATTAVYVLIGGRETHLGAANSAKEFDEALDRSQSDDPPADPDAEEMLESHQYTPDWRARFYTGLTRDALRRLGQHAAKPWWSRALLCRQSPPWPYDIADIGYLEGELHDLLDGAYWLKREGRATHEDAIRPDRERDLETAHFPAIVAAIRLLGVPLDSEAQVAPIMAETHQEAAGA
jgi:hypothetical protein